MAPVEVDVEGQVEVGELARLLITLLSTGRWAALDFYSTRKRCSKGRE